MAPPVSKRRKTEHSSSDSEPDDASFASFGESADEQSATSVDAESQDTSGNEEDRNISSKTFADEGDGQHVLGRSNGKAATGDQSKSPPKQSSRIQIRAGAAAHHGSIVQAMGTFKSNMFKLQVDELLAQIRPRHGQREIEAEGVLHSLKKCIEQIPSREPRSIHEAEKQLLLSKIAIPFPEPRPPKDAQYKLEYASPTSINVIGSHVLKTSSRRKNELEIDMLVQMPTSLFQPKDYMNRRYIYKRAFYLAVLAEGLKKQKFTENYLVRFVLSGDDPLKPILVVSPANDEHNDGIAKLRRHWKINILPAIAQDCFPAEKLLLGRNCLRSPHEDTRDPTPSYNASLRADMLLAPYLKLLYNAATTCKAFRDACLLGTTWLNQRGLGSSITKGGFGTFEWSALIALMLQSGGTGGKSILSPEHSSYQLFKASLQMLATKDVAKQALVFGEDPSSPDKAHLGYPTIWDAARSHNILYKMSAWSWQSLRQEAVNTLQMLADQLCDGFEGTFITKSYDTIYRYDQTVELLLPSKANRKDELEKLHAILQCGLSDRARLVNIIAPATSSWPISSAQPASTRGLLTKVGIVVNPDTVNRTIDHGPSAQDKSASVKFREFWGDLAELRRFKDGSILESLVWSSKSGVPVLHQIVRAVLQRHFGESIANTARLSGDDIAKVLRYPDSKSSFHALNEAFKEVERDIRDLDALPLTIRQMRPADAQLRSASIVPPSISRQLPSPAAITIEFEGSGRWPGDLVAIQRTKIAFLLKLGELLGEAKDSVTCRVGLENENNDTLNQAFLDIIYDSGLAFRLRIHHDREQTLLERQLKDKSVDPKTKEVASVGLAMYKRDYLRTPAYTQAVAGLCNKYSSLSGTIRLMKKWFASHFLINHFREETIELIAIRTFVQPWPYQAPSSVTVAFLRTLLWLSKWDWRTEPLIIDISASGELSKEDVRGIQTRFEAWRKLDPGMSRVCVFAASNIDPDGSTYTDGKPAKVVVGRMTALAKAACAEAEALDHVLEPLALFSSPLEDFDFVIHLNHEASGGRQGGQKAAFKNLELAALDDTTSIGFEPELGFIRDLEHLYGHAILFFHGGSERPVIAGLWSPQTAPRSWKVNLAYSSMAVNESHDGDDGDIKAVINKQAIISEMARLGGDLVRKIDLVR